METAHAPVAVPAGSIVSIQPDPRISTLGRECVLTEKPWIPSMGPSHR